MVDALSRKAALAMFQEVRDRTLAPLSTVTPREFAETIMRMPDAHGATRSFTFGFAPYQLEPFLEIFNPRNQEVALMMASRLGKSRIVLTALGYFILLEPCRIAVMWPVEGDGKLWVKDDFMGELVEPTPEIAAIIGDSTGQRTSSNTILHKAFAGGLLQVVGSNAPGRLRRIKGRFLYADEIDGIQDQAMESKSGAKGRSEGDILDVFAKRGSEYGDCRQVYCSYPSLKGHSRIEMKLAGSDYRKWFVTCLICGGEPYVMHRDQLRYDRDRPQDARLECPRCKNFLTDDQRHAQMMGGDPKHPRYDLWRPTQPFTGKAGFHANSMLMPHKHGDPDYLAKFPGGYLQELAQKEIAIEADANPERRRMVLTNTEDAETYSRPCDAKPESGGLLQRREKYDPKKMLPAGVLWICITWDIQADRAEGEFVGFGLKGHTWGLGYEIVRGSPQTTPDKGIWKEMDRLFTMATFPHPSGATLRPSGELVDRGYMVDYVLAYTRPRARRGTYASRGATTLSKPMIPSRPKLEGSPKAKVFELGTHEAKDIIYQRLARDNKAADGYMHYPDLPCYSEKYFKQLTIEDSEDQKGPDGKWYRAFTCKQGDRNEPLDVRVMALAIFAIRKPKMAKLALELAVPDPGAPKSAANGQSAPKVAPAAPQKSRPFVNRQAPGGSFVRNWRH